MKCRLDIREDIIDSVKTRIPSKYVIKSNDDVLELNNEGRKNMLTVSNELEKINNLYGDPNLTTLNYEVRKILIDPSEELVDKYFKAWMISQYSSDEVSDSMLEEQDNKHINAREAIITSFNNKEFTNRREALAFLRENSNAPFSYKLLFLNNKYELREREDYSLYNEKLEEIETCA